MARSNVNAVQLALVKNLPRRYVANVPLAELKDYPGNPKLGRPPKHQRRTCDGCPTIFRPPGTGSKRPKRFCSKRCWYAWHRGTNHQQFARRTVTCEWCGDDFSRSESALAKVEHHFCSYACSGAARSASMRGGVPQPARYYSLAHWRSVRETIIARDGGCVRCGLTDNAHQQRYGCSLHVHHKIRRSNGGSDDPSNLESLCCGCHAIETGNGN